MSVRIVLCMADCCVDQFCSQDISALVSRTDVAAADILLVSPRERCTANAHLDSLRTHLSRSAAPAALNRRSAASSRIVTSTQASKQCLRGAASVMLTRSLASRHTACQLYFVPRLLSSHPLRTLATRAPTRLQGEHLNSALRPLSAWKKVRPPPAVRRLALCESSLTKQRCLRGLLRAARAERGQGVDQAYIHLQGLQHRIRLHVTQRTAGGEGQSPLARPSIRSLNHSDQRATHASCPG